MFNNFKKAFTMAEVLMVLGIIGVVAAITIPNLKDSADEQFYVAKAAKVYSEMETAFSRAQMKYGENILDWSGVANNTTGTGIASKMKKYMDVTTDCGTGANKRCWKDSSTENTAAYKLELKDGTTMSFYNDIQVPALVHYPFPGTIVFDLDGPSKGPNTMGIDQFRVAYDAKKISSGIDMVGYNGITSPTGEGFYLAWVLKYGNEDYMKCASSLSFTGGNTSCK